MARGMEIESIEYFKISKVMLIAEKQGFRAR